MTFDYGIVADGSQAVAESVKVEKSLTGIEQHAAKVGQAMSAGFEKGAASARDAQGRIQASGVAVKDFEAALQRIHAPYDTLEKDMRVLDALQAQGVISAKQYADELARIGKAAGLSRADPLAAVSLPTAPKGEAGGLLDTAAGKIAAMVAPAALAGTALKLIGDEFGRWAQHNQDIRDATNSILKFHDSIDDASAAMREQKDLSSDLGINIKRTARAYADTREGLDALGLSSKQYTDITRQVTAALIVDGGASEDVTGIMAKLQYVNETGILTQSDLHKLYRQSPEIVKGFAASLGVSVTQLIEMAKQGKLTGATLEKMEIGLGTGTKATDKYAQRFADLSAIMEDQHVNAYDALKIALDLGTAYQNTDGPLTKIIESTNEYGLSLQHTAKAGQELLEKIQTMNAISAVQSSASISSGLAKAGLAVQATLDAQGNRYEQWSLKMRDFREQLEKSGASADVVAEQMAKIHGPDWVDYYLQQLDAIRQPERDWAGRMQALETLFLKGKISAIEYADALGRVTGHLRELGPDKPRTYASGPSGADVMHDLQGKEYRAPGTAGSGSEYGIKADENFGQPFDPMNPKTTAESMQKSYEYTEKLASATKKWNDELHKTDTTALAVEESLKSGVGSFGDTLVDAANGADVSWKKFFENFMIDIEKAIVKAELLKLLGGSDTGVGGGGSGVLGFLFGGGHATGGSYTAPDTGGGPDSIPVLFKMNPGETANFTNRGELPPSSQLSGGGQAAPIHLSFHVPGGNTEDVVQAVDSRAGDSVVFNMLRKNRRALRSLTSRRR